jgi:glycosyltransferase EpsD
VDTAKFYKSSEDERKEIRKELGLSTNDFVVAIIGELNDNKNQEVIIKAIASIKDKCPRLKALLMGVGENADKLKTLCSQLNTDDIITFLGYRTDIDKILSVCDLGVSASIREGLGLNILEEMASGLPVVASANRGHKDLVTKESGILVDITSVGEFAEAIMTFYNSPEKCEAASKNNLERCKKFDLELVKPLLLSIIEG